MDALEILRSHKKQVVDQWTEAVFATYPLETAGFLRTRHDPFTNPVAHMTRQAADALYEALTGADLEPEQVKTSVERFIKLRAVQKFNPGQNMAVFYLVKPILRQIVLPPMLEQGYLAEYLDVESRLDTLALLAFDMFSSAREILAESRIKEIRNQYAQLAKWAQKLECGAPDVENAADGMNSQRGPGPR